MGEAVPHHRTPEFKEVVETTLPLLQKLLDCKKAAAFASTGTGGLEAALVNFLSKGEKLLYLDAGKFGERWGQIGNCYSIETIPYKIPWGAQPDFTKLESLLKTHQPAAFGIQSCETSTGTEYPLKEISQLIHRVSPETLILVDGITATGALDIGIQSHGIDALVGGSQKALGLATGLSFLGISERAFEKACQTDTPRFYFDIRLELDSYKKGITRFSSPVQLWMTLQKQLEILFEEGLEKRLQRNIEIRDHILSWAKSHNLEPFSKSPSPSVTALLTPPSLPSNELISKVKEKGFLMANGQDGYKNKIFRIGHLGNVSLEEVTELLKAIEDSLKELGHG